MKLLRGILRTAVGVIGVTIFICGELMWTSDIVTDRPGATALLVIGVLMIADTVLPRQGWSTDHPSAQSPGHKG